MLKAGLQKIKEDNPQGYVELQNVSIRRGLFDSNCDYSVDVNTARKALGISKRRARGCREDSLNIVHTGRPHPHGLTKKDAGNHKLVKVQEKFKEWLEDQIHPSGRSEGIVAYFDERFSSVTGKQNGLSIVDAFNEWLEKHPVLENKKMMRRVTATSVWKWTHIYFPHTTIRPAGAEGYCGTCTRLENIQTNCSARRDRTKQANKSGAQYKTSALAAERKRVSIELNEHKELAHDERQQYKDDIAKCGTLGSAINTMYRVSKGWVRVTRAFRVKFGRKVFSVTPTVFGGILRYKVKLGLRLVGDHSEDSFVRKFKRLAKGLWLLWLKFKDRGPFEIVVSIDFAKSREVPHFGHSKKAAALYFYPHIAYTVLGICVHWFPTSDKRCFHLYVSPEVTGNKTSDYIISALEIALRTLPLGLREALILKIYMDNTTSTNKNRNMVGYALYLVENRFWGALQLLGFTNVIFEFMPVGHTKFWPDNIFAALANACLKVDLFTELALLERCRKVADFVVLMDVFQLYGWSRVLAQRYSMIPQIMKYNYFLFYSDNDGVPHTRVKSYATAEDGLQDIYGGTRFSEYDVWTTLRSYDNAEEAMANLKVYKDAKFRKLNTLWDTFIPGGLDVSERPSVIQFETAAAAACFLLKCSMEEADAIVKSADPTRVKSTSHRISESCRLWSVDILHGMLVDCFLKPVADKLKLHGVTGEQFIDMADEDFESEPFLLSEVDSKDLMHAQNALKAL